MFEQEPPKRLDEMEATDRWLHDNLRLGPCPANLQVRRQPELRRRRGDLADLASDAPTGRPPHALSVPIVNPGI
jgi:hypothetical protein